MGRRRHSNSVSPQRLVELAFPSAGTIRPQRQSRFDAGPSGNGKSWLWRFQGRKDPVLCKSLVLRPTWARDCKVVQSRSFPCSGSYESDAHDWEIGHDERASSGTLWTREERNMRSSLPRFLYIVSTWSLKSRIPAIGSRFTKNWQFWEQACLDCQETLQLRRHYHRSRDDFLLMMRRLSEFTGMMHLEASTTLSDFWNTPWAST